MQIKNQYTGKALAFLQRLGDIRFAGQVVFVIIVLMISWSGIKTIQTNYGLQKKITALNQQSELQKLQNDNLALQNQYFNSNQYLELSARQNFGLAAPGDKEVIVPQSVALANTVDLPSTNKPDLTKTKQPTYQRHLESWINFFLHRRSSDN